MISLRGLALSAGFIAPCLPTSAAQPPSGERWLHEINRDPAKGDPGGEAPRPRPPPPSFTGVILALRVTGTSHSPRSAG
jgi:hypothetical protein